MRLLQAGFRIPFYKRETKHGKKIRVHLQYFVRTDIGDFSDILSSTLYANEGKYLRNMGGKTWPLKQARIPVIVGFIPFFVKTFRSYPVNPVNPVMKTIITHFVFHIKNDQHGTGKTQAQSRDVDEGIDFVPG